MFYDEFVKLCNSVNKTPTAVAKEIGLAGAHVTKWKKGSTPTDATTYKICDYFELPNDYFKKEKAPTPGGVRRISDEDIKFALFGGDGDITDAMYDEVKRFAHMVKLREEAAKKKE